MKENAKLYKSQKTRTQHMLSKRLAHEEEKQGDGMDLAGEAQKKKKMADGSSLPVAIGSQQSLQGPQKQK